MMAAINFNGADLIEEASEAEEVVEVAEEVITRTKVRIITTKARTTTLALISITNKVKAHQVLQ